MLNSNAFFSVSILGLTIDYGRPLERAMHLWISLTLAHTGPYAFMDVFDKYHICNHTDGEGRYSYQVCKSRTPTLVPFAHLTFLCRLNHL